jgi:hypothetical protein
MNPLGIVTAISTFLGIWIGHVGVRAIERRAVHLWKPILGAIALGLGLVWVSLTAPSRALSVSAGVFATTLLWDALELHRQEKRVQKGHAPANPQNPRHAQILAAYPAATTTDYLARDPLGHPVDAADAARRAEGSA